jgi:glycosyltransferase involved in cell wall biosynthesis
MNDLEVRESTSAKLRADVFSNSSENGQACGVKANCPVILTMCDYYLPGYKAGGPIRSLSSTIESLGDKLCFKVITRDRDAGDRDHYPGIKPDSWHNVGKAEVFYSPPSLSAILELRKVICTANPEVLYLNSFFSPKFSIYPIILRWFGLIPQIPVVVAPRGEFSSGALGIKSGRKRVYLALAKALGLYKGVIWQASSVWEEEQIYQRFGTQVSVIVASDFHSRTASVVKKIRRRPKLPGRLRILFLSRISRMKNLAWALTILKELTGDVEFSIYGLLEDLDYWSECQKIIRLLPQHIKVQYYGTIQPECIEGIMMEHDLFFLPSLGENFGHVILEALLAGCPVLISDRTPWRGLESKGAGWDLPLHNPEQFQVVLQRCIQMDAQSHSVLSECARDYGLQYYKEAQDREKSFETFLFACANGRG